MKVAVTTLAVCVASLLALGLVMLYSASMVIWDKHTNAEIGAHYLMMQLVWCACGLVLCFTAARLNYQWLKREVVVFALFGLALLLLVLVYPFPHLPHLPDRYIKMINGAHRWFILPGGTRLQPSEIGKLAVIFTLAWYGDRYQRRMQTLGWGILVPVLLTAPLLALIFIEPDRGTTILLAAVTGSILLMAGVQWKFIVPPIILAIGAFTVSIIHDPMRMKRIFSWLDVEAHKDGVGYQAYQAKIALGSGGFAGLGLGNGRQKLGFVPEHHTDFIFSIIGEELGLIATLLVIVAFMVLVWCGIYIALRAADRFGTLLATGVTLLIGLQAVINIGVVTSALPNKGLPLPFISYGGSNLLAMLTCVGILFSVARRASPEKVPVPDFVTDENPNPFAAKAA